MQLMTWPIRQKQYRVINHAKTSMSTSFTPFQSIRVRSWPLVIQKALSALLAGLLLAQRQASEGQTMKLLREAEGPPPNCSEDLPKFKSICSLCSCTKDSLTEKRDVEGLYSVCTCKHNSASTNTVIYCFMMMTHQGLSKDDTPGFTLVIHLYTLRAMWNEHKAVQLLSVHLPALPHPPPQNQNCAGHSLQ